MHKILILILLFHLFSYSSKPDLNLNELLSKLNITKIVLREKTTIYQGEKIIKSYKTAVVSDPSEIKMFIFIARNKRGKICMCGNQMYLEYYSGEKLVFRSGLPKNHKTHYRNISINGLLINNVFQSRQLYTEYKNTVLKLNKDARIQIKKYQKMFSESEIDTIFIK